MTQLRELTPQIRIGAAIERHNLTIFPLFSEDAFAPAVYTPVGAALRGGSARITEISEGGSVPNLALENLAAIPVLIIDGEELLGAKQNRISNLTVLAPGNATLSLPVSMNMARQGSRVSDQGSVWEDIDALSSKLGVRSSTSAMQDVFENKRASIAEYLSDVTAADGQIGAILSINGAAAGMELFDSTDTFRTCLPKILRSYAVDALANQTVGRASAPDGEAERLLTSILERRDRSRRTRYRRTHPPSSPNPSHRTTGRAQPCNAFHPLYRRWPVSLRRSRENR